MNNYYSLMLIDYLFDFELDVVKLVYQLSFLFLKDICVFPSSSDVVYYSITLFLEVFDVC